MGMQEKHESQYQPVPLPDYIEYPPQEMQSRTDAFLAMIKKRHTVRDFSSRPVSRLAQRGF
jgi:iodotyrosine deiodinase